MSGLAQHLHGLGYEVSGSDREQSEMTDKLSALGIEVHIGHSAENVVGAQMTVRTSAVGESNVEVRRSEELGIPVLLREELLGTVFNSFEKRVAICGTHGKTTVTAMVHEILAQTNVAHTAFIGGVYKGSNYYGGGDIVVAEACEFNRSFYNLQPTICVCLNAEWDHPDCYANAEEVRQAFAHFAHMAEDVVLLPYELRNLAPRNKRAYIDKSLAVENLSLCEGKPQFDLVGEQTCPVRLSVAGQHNVYNALASVQTACLLGVPLTDACRALTQFVGVKRRWTEKYVPELGRVVADYAHHPTEITCSVLTAKSVCKGRVLCVFQPHTYTRTKAFFRQFVTCFSQADAVAYLPVYSAREKPIAHVNSYDLAQKAVNMGLNATFVADFASAKQWILGNMTPDDILLVLGAGDIVKLVDML